MGVGKRVKEARERLGLTQRELGEIIGVTPSAVTNYENGTSHPKEPVLLRLIEALRVDANFLFQDIVRFSDSNEYTNIEKNLVENYRSLNEEGQEKAFEYVEDLVLTGRYIKHFPNTEFGKEA